MNMTLGKQTFGLSKKDYSEKLGRVIQNHRVNTRLIGEPRELILRSCRLCSSWEKLSGDPDVLVYLRNVEIAGGRKVKMLSLERGETKQPVSKSKLIDALYPVKKIKTSATEEEKHYNAVKSSMRIAIAPQLQSFRKEACLPTVCYLTGKTLRKGHRTDVDHVGLSFSEIADKFVQQSGLKYSDIALVGPPTAKRFRDEELWNKWLYFHECLAKLTLVCASANRSKGAGDYTTPDALYGSFSRESPEDLALDF
jgi:hypothetical protein